MENIESTESLLKMAEHLEEENGFKLLSACEELTEEEMFSYDLIGIINMDDIDKPRVLIIKNRMNDISGFVPLSTWLSLIEDKIALNKERDQEESQENTQEEFNLNDVFADLSKTFGDTFTETFGDIKTTNFINETRSVIENVIDRVLNEKENISIKLELEELKLIRESAIRNKVQTKGFLKKIDKRILLAESFLLV